MTPEQPWTAEHDAMCDDAILHNLRSLRSEIESMEGEMRFPHVGQYANGEFWLRASAIYAAIDRRIEGYAERGRV